MSIGTELMLLLFRCYKAGNLVEFNLALLRFSGHTAKCIFSGCGQSDSYI